jgi:hypothetical protein
VTNADGRSGRADQPPPNPHGGYAAPPPYQVQTPGYPPATYPGYPPVYPSYPPAYPGYAPAYPSYPPAYPGYPAPGYRAQLTPPALKPGVIPLRPLTLSEIFNGAIAYIRTNPTATLGLTTGVVIAAQILSLILQFIPLIATGGLDAFRGNESARLTLVGLSASAVVGPIAIGLSGIVLNGILTVLVGRAVFGAKVSAGEAWRRARGRVLALLGFTALEALGAVVLIAGVVLVIAGVAAAANGVAAVLVGLPLAGCLLALLIYLGTLLSFAPPLIVLERLPVIASIKRSFALVRGGFWRVLGIWLLAAIVAGIVSGSVSVPFRIVGQILLVGNESTGKVMIGLVLLAVGAAIGQIVTAPFTAGVIVLLYADRRMRAEAFDLVLQTAAAWAPGGPADSTDQLWLTRSI